MPALGEVIAERYRLEQQLGVGAMGSVWRATHLTLGSQVAIKIINRAAARDPRSLARFEREAVLAARIKSDHVVRVLDHGHHDELPFIVMDYLEGEDLRHRLEARVRLSIAETGVIIRHVARALTAAHEIGLVHRDIKPENIFLSPGDEDGTERIRVLDFGVAKVSDTIAVSGLDPTQTGALIGTPYYLSPEQARGLKSLGPPADLWSLGVVAFECLTGERPFSAPAMGPLIAKITHGVIPVPSELLPGLAQPIDDWFKKALTREPQGRYRNAKEMAAAYVIASGLADSMSAGKVTPRISEVNLPAAMPDHTVVVDEASPVVHANRLAPDAATTLAIEETATRSDDAATLAWEPDHGKTDPRLGAAPLPQMAIPQMPIPQAAIAQFPPAPATDRQGPGVGRQGPGMDTLLRAPWPATDRAPARYGLVVGVVLAFLAIGGVVVYLLVSFGSTSARATTDESPRDAASATSSSASSAGPVPEAPSAETSGPELAEPLSASAASSDVHPAPGPASSASTKPKASGAPQPGPKPWSHRTTLD